MRTEPITTSTAVNISQTYLVPDAHIVSLLECAGTGIAYWVELAHIDTQARTYYVRPDREAREDPEIRTRALKFEWIAKRLVQLGVDSPLLSGVSPDSAVSSYARRYLAALIDPDDDDPEAFFDSELADVVVQLAFFDGKVIFG